jgi:hypothetical protein
VISLQRVLRLGALVLIGTSAAGCVVLPYGGGYHRGHGGYRYGAAPPPPTVIIEGQQRPPHYRR